jgi:hypothetical protein
MAEEEYPAVASPFVEADRAILRFSMEVGSDIANVECHVISFLVYLISQQ